MENHLSNHKVWKEVFPAKETDLVDLDVLEQSLL